MTGRRVLTGLRRRARLLAETGLSMVETTIVLSVLTALTGVLAPAGMELVQQAREAQVERECASLRNAVIKLLVDSNRTVIRLGQGRGLGVDLLVSSGAVPETDGAADARWLQTPDGSGAVDLLDRYLVENMPAGDAAQAWPRPTSLESGGWRGAYVATVPSADPWGHRYAINVQYLATRYDVVVLSAGANGQVDTPFESRALLPGGDDHAVLVR